jgi:hypothetical protein
MPRLSVWMIRTALTHLGIGFTFGALLLWNKGLPFDPNIWRLLMPHVELVVFGWTMQLAMGVGYWILPRFPVVNRRYGRAWLGWLSYILFNEGVILTALGYWLSHQSLMVGGRAAALLGILCFVSLIWFRVKPFAEGNPHEPSHRRAADPAA